MFAATTSSHGVSLAYPQHGTQAPNSGDLSDLSCHIESVAISSAHLDQETAQPSNSPCLKAARQRTVPDHRRESAAVQIFPLKKPISSLSQTIAQTCHRQSPNSCYTLFQTKRPSSRTTPPIKKKPLTGCQTPSQGASVMDKIKFDLINPTAPLRRANAI